LVVGKGFGQTDGVGDAALVFLIRVFQMGNSPVIAIF